ncbi:hypothetical protein Llac01_11840 [Leuconostoc lactis]|nr:hypothetical protein LLA04_13590 [Leuconostoc lactis]GLY45807.1 hypothetical protein Llac01_11840 [Leuconostoc lactis]
MNRRFKKPGTHVDHSQRPNLIKHQPNARIWRADITYLELRPGTWVYLSSIYEPKVHQVLAFKIGRQMEATLVVEIINQALECHQKPQYFHSDMGSQYTSNEVETLLERHQISHSYSKQGYPYDNGPIEAFHSLLKREFAFQTTFLNFIQLYMSYRHVLNQCNDVFTDHKNSSAKLWLTGINTADTLLRYLSKQHDSYILNCQSRKA